MRRVRQNTIARQRVLPICKNSGFTLVELLVVIAVVGLLLSLLLPALGRAKDNSKLLICRTNQRSLLLGSLAYAAENDSALPVDLRLHNSHIKLVETLSSGDYIKGAKVYYCPSEKDEELKYSEENFSDGAIGYFYYCFSDRPKYKYLSIFFLKKTPWPRILTDTAKPDKWVFSDSWFSNRSTSHRWYKKGVNYITLDGAVQMVEKSPKSKFK